MSHSDIAIMYKMENKTNICVVADECKWLFSSLLFRYWCLWGGSWRLCDQIFHSCLGKRKAKRSQFRFKPHKWLFCFHVLVLRLSFCVQHCVAVASQQQPVLGALGLLPEMAAADGCLWRSWRHGKLLPKIEQVDLKTNQNCMSQKKTGWLKSFYLSACTMVCRHSTFSQKKLWGPRLKVS